MAAGRLVHALRNRERSRFAGGEIVKIDVFVAVDVSAEGDVLAVGRKFVPRISHLSFVSHLISPGLKTPLSSPLVPTVEQAQVVVSIRCVRCDKYLLAVGN